MNFPERSETIYRLKYIGPTAPELRASKIASRLGGSEGGDSSVGALDHKNSSRTLCALHTLHRVCVLHRIESHSSCTTLHSLFVHSKRLNEEGFQKGDKKNPLLYLLIFYEDQTLGVSSLPIVLHLTWHHSFPLQEIFSSSKVEHIYVIN